MKIGIRAIDHIVYCVYDLDHAITTFAERLGIAPSFGGYHTTKGTKNALLNLGNQCYLEFLAADKDNTNFTGERWMGIDILTQPQITRWALKSAQMNLDGPILQSYDSNMGRMEEGQRKRSDGTVLKWSMSMPLATPEIEVVPFLTDWSASTIHPTDSLPDECRLIDLLIYHPDPASIQPVFEQLSVDCEVIQSDKASIKIKVECPNGIIEL